jgi:N-acetylmuramic acid 6-phosphate etherase
MDADSFLKVCSQFRLGELVTEQPHPDSIGLAELAQSDLFTSLDVFHGVDRLAMSRLLNSIRPLSGMVKDLKETLSGGGRIFISGCGATGRLALSLETFARESWLQPGREEQIVSFMAGGDTALIRSIESFEDYPEFGQRQLQELGFSENDILLAITEGGETPWVIGTCLEAASVSRHPPWFLFCNPPDLLCKLAERSAKVLQSDKIRSFYLDIGPMALAGSTRLQATTAQMLVAGGAISEALGHESAEELISGFDQLITTLDYSFLAPFIEAESNVYGMGNQVLYETDNYGITVLTDTTERSPTFSLAPFENKHRKMEKSSWCYLSIQGTDTAKSAWENLLHRSPRALDWSEFEYVASFDTLMGYDISSRAADWRKSRCPEAKQYPYLVFGDGPVLEFAGHTYDFGLYQVPVLLRHLVLKCALNAQSTLVMGRLGFFESNLMTRVKPSNYKLIDRAARHAQHFHLQKTGQHLDYKVAVLQVFESLK